MDITSHNTQDLLRKGYHMKGMTKFRSAAVFGIASLVGSFMLGCTTNDKGATNVVVEVPIVFTKRANNAIGDPLDTVSFGAGGELMYKGLASAGTEPVVVTSNYTKGQGDVSDPEVHPDGHKIIFSMFGPGDTKWNIWEWYLNEKDIPQDVIDTIKSLPQSEQERLMVDAIPKGKLVRVIKNDTVAAMGDDIDPNYLLDGKIVFSSDRQKTSRMITNSVDPATPAQALFPWRETSARQI